MQVSGTSFKNTMNMFPSHTWEFSQLSSSVDFMDMTITINDKNHIETTLFKKKLNLHLSFPSTLPTPVPLPGIVYSTLF